LSGRDIHIVARIILTQSLTNLTERVMLVLNLAMQFGAMCRGNMREDIEKDMNSIRSLAKSLYKISAIPVDTYVQNSG
jgi:hypothetical protein